MFTAFGVNEAERAFAAINMLNRGIGEDRVFAMTGANAATVAYIQSLDVASIKELSFSQLVKLGTMNLKANTKQILAHAAAWAASPLGMATIAVTGIFLLIKAVDLFTVSLEEAQEKLAELKEAYIDNENELTTLNNELQTTIDRINELQGKDSLTFTEAEELDNLRKQNAELERQIALFETVQKQKMLGIHKTFIDVMEKDVNNVDDKKFNSSGAYTTTKYDKLVSKNYKPTDYKDWRKENGGHITRISEQEYIKAVMMRREEVVNSLSGKLTDKERESLSSLLNEIDDYLTDKSQEFADAADGISYISNPTTYDEKKVNEWLDFINDFNDKLMITMDHPKAKENALNRLIYGGFSNATSELKNLGKQGEVTAKHLTDPRYDEFIQKCIDLGIITEENEESLAFLALAFNSLGDAVVGVSKDMDFLYDAAKNSIEKLVDYRKQMLEQDMKNQKEALDDQIDALKDFYDKQREMLRDQYDEEQYLAEQHEKQKAVTDLKAELAMLSNDDSAWAQRRKLELQDEIAKAEGGLADFENEHALDVTIDMLDTQQELQEKQIQSQIDTLDAKLNDPHALYNLALADIKNNTSDLYQAMLEFNRKYGSGKDDDIVIMWSNAHKYSQEYTDASGLKYQGILIGNYTSGYASGTDNAAPGLHRVDEFGAEYVFVSPSDGSRYRMFRGGEKVLTAQASDFLYQFANSGGSIITRILPDLLKHSDLVNISKPVQAIEVHAGNIIVEGNASAQTVSEIRRAHRDNLEFVLKELKKLNK